MLGLDQIVRIDITTTGMYVNRERQKDREIECASMCSGQAHELQDLTSLDETSTVSLLQDHASASFM